MTTNQTIDGVPREFVREGRYIVVKPDYEDDIRTERLRNYIEEMCFHTPDCVVVEADWPEYEPVWRMIEARVIGNPTELDAAKATISQLQGLVAELRALLDAPAENMIDVSATDWAAIQEAASESTWMPPEYMRNDWVSDVCRFLREGAAAQLGAEGFYQQVTDADIKKISDYMGNPDMPTGAFLRQDAYDLANMTTHMCREVQALRNKLATPPQGEPVALLSKGFTTLETSDGKYRIITQYKNRDDAWSDYMALCKAEHPAPDDQPASDNQFYTAQLRALLDSSITDNGDKPDEERSEALKDMLNFFF